MDYKKVFLDINIVIDAIDSNRKNNKVVKKLIYQLIVNNYQIVISEDMLSTIFYIQKDKIEVLTFFDVIKDDWTISVFGESVIRDSIRLSLEKRLDFEDTLQCLCAKENGCMGLITNDKSFYACGIDIYSTNDFLERLK